MKADFSEVDRASDESLNYELTPDELERIEAAKYFVGKDMLARKSQQSVDYMIFVRLVFVVVAGYFVIKITFKPPDVSSMVLGNDPPTVTPVSARPEVTLQPAFDPRTPISVVIQNPVTVQPTFTPAPTYTPYPTFTPAASPTPSIYKVSQALYSYYWPPLLGPNCHADNVIMSPKGKPKGCKDTTASGEKWSEWRFDAVTEAGYRGGVAVPLSWPLWVTVRVLAPADIAGDYLAVDYCPCCEQNPLCPLAKPDKLWLDFVDDTQRLPWSQALKIEVYPPYGGVQ